MKKLFVVGDSISIHYGPFLQSMLKGRFAYDRKRGDSGNVGDIDNLSQMNGGDSSMVLDYLHGQKEKGFWTDILLLNCGLHDIKRHGEEQTLQIEAETYGGNLKSILDVASTLAGKIFWIRTTLLDDTQHAANNTAFRRRRVDAIAYNEISDCVMRERGIEAIDLSGFTESLGEGVYCDHVHFEEGIRKLQAAFIAGRVWDLA